MIILGVDLGKARTGVAVCDKSEMLASPVEVVYEHGRARNMDGSEGESAQNARAFGAELHALCGLPVDFSDERGTTVTAHNFLNETNTRGKKRKAAVDAVAATIILQDYLDFRRNRKG